jgi:ABC-type multidrug transport system permease subunit
MWWSHLLKASLMITLLLGTLITLSLFSAQILSAQGSLLLIFLIYLVGSFQTNIEHLLFPAPPVLAGMPQVEPSLGFSEVITTAIWKPLLWLVPDFQNLNPINSLMNGEFISWSFIWEQGISIGPFLAICSFYLIYFLPKRERAIDR